MRHVRDALPVESILYVADQAHVPYGSRSVREIRRFGEGITRFLLSQGAKIIVVACNTASAAALTHLRRTFPAVPIVGMEPAVKPAALQTSTGKVGVLATPATFASPRYSALMARFAAGVAVYEDPCVGLVDLIEQGQLDGPQTSLLLNNVLAPMLQNDVDTFVLGCTHYPFVVPLIASIVAARGDGRPITIIDPAPAVARQVGRVLDASGLLSASLQPGSILLYSTGGTEMLARLAAAVLDRPFAIQQLGWSGASLETARSGSL